MRWGAARGRIGAALGFRDRPRGCGLRARSSERR